MGGFVFPFPGDMPPEMKAELERQHQLQHMSYEDQMHRLLAFFDGFDLDGLRQLNAIVRTAGENEMGPDMPMSNYYMGLIAAFKYFKFGMCFCGSKHPDTVEGLEPEEPESVNKKEPDDGFENLDADDLHYYLQSGLKSAELTETLVLYNMELAPIKGNESKLYLRCKGCQTPSPNLRDRMLREPGVKGCSTCQQNAKWG